MWLCQHDKQQPWSALRCWHWWPMWFDPQCCFAPEQTVAWVISPSPFPGCVTSVLGPADLSRAVPSLPCLILVLMLAWTGQSLLLFLLHTEGTWWGWSASIESLSTDCSNHRLLPPLLPPANTCVCTYTPACTVYRLVHWISLKGTLLKSTLLFGAASGQRHCCTNPPLHFQF